MASESFRRSVTWAYLINLVFSQRPRLRVLRMT
jgi:hypothetical protein